MRVGRIWDAAEHAPSVRRIYTEARAALAQAARLGWLTSEDLATAIGALAGLDEQLDLVEIDDTLVRHGGDLAQHRDLSVAAGQLGIAVASTVNDDG